MANYVFHHGDALQVLPTLESNSVDAVIADPPYPMIQRSYGMLTEAEWWDLMMGVCKEVRRILKLTGSAVFVLQPNSRKVGSMRGWLWRFMLWATEEWNMVQDAWWWSPSAPPTAHCQREQGLMRPSVKACVWLGGYDCYRNQDEVLWSQSEANKAVQRTDRLLQRKPSGQSMKPGRCAAVADERGGVTPFNLLPIPNTDSTNSAGANGHGAGTPETLCSWWCRYICPPGGVVLDPFCGSGTVGVAALKQGRQFIGVEKVAEYVAIVRRRLDDAVGPLFADVVQEPVPPEKECTLGLFPAD